MNSKEQTEKALMSSIFIWWGRFAYNHPWIMMVCCTTFVVLSAWFALDIQMQTDILQMLPLDSPMVRTMMVTLDDFNSFDQLYLVLSAEQCDPDMRQEVLEHYADLLAAKLVTSDLISRVTYKRSPEMMTMFLDFIMPRISRYIPPEKMPDLLAKLEPEAMESAFSRQRRLLISQPATTLRDLIVRDPLNLVQELSVLMPSLSALSEFSGFDPEADYFFAKGGHKLLIIVEPSFAAQDVEQSQKLVSWVAQCQTALDQTWSDEALPRLDLAGGPAIAVSDEQHIRRDMQLTIVSSLIGIFILFQLAFRHWLSPLIVFIPLIYGITTTLGFAGLILGKLNILSSIFAVILVGLGIDFSIHLYHRYLTEGEKGLCESDAISITYDETVRSIFTGAVTTSAAFLAITLTDFRGLRELGLIAGVGILLTFLHVISMFPVIIRLGSIKARKRSPYHKPHRFWQLAERSICTYRWYIIIAIGLSSAILLWDFCRHGGLSFETELNTIRPEDSPVWQTQQDIAQTFLWQGEPLLAVIQGKSLVELARQVEQLDQYLASSQTAPYISSVLSLKTLYPPACWFEQNRNDLLGIDLNSFRAAYTDAARQAGFALDMLEPARKAYETMLSNPPPICYETLENNLGRDLLSTFAHENNGVWTVVTYIYLDRIGNREENIIQLAESIETSLPHIAVTGMQRIIPEFKRIIRHDFSLATLGAILTVFILLILHFRSGQAVILSLLPLGLGVLWTLAIMRLLDLQLNFINMIVTPMLIGIGIDDGIHIVNHYRLQRKDDLARHNDFELLTIPGKGIVLTSLTTMIGFGSLSMAHYPGLQWIGLLTVLGVFLCLAFSTVFLPALIYAGHKENSEKSTG
ncbi:MMPL family transporter [bacterium]|nr:MMPL family transporter [bacterium]